MILLEEQGRAMCAAVLLPRGADVRKIGPRGQTPLHFAASGGGTKVARVLLSAGADISARREDGLTPADVAR